MEALGVIGDELPDDCDRRARPCDEPQQCEPLTPEEKKKREEMATQRRAEEEEEGKLKPAGVWDEAEAAAWTAQTNDTWKELGIVALPGDR